MKGLSFELDFQDFENNLKMLFILKGTEIFPDITNRIFLGAIYPDLVDIDETATDVAVMLTLDDSFVLPLALKSDEERDKFAKFLVKIMPSIKNKALQPLG